MTPFLENPSDGSNTIMLTTWIPFTDDIYVSVDRDKILVIVNASDRLVSHYKKVVTMIVERNMKEELEMMMRMILGKKYNPAFDPRTLGKREDAAVGPSPDWNPKDTDARKYKKLFEDERVEKILFEALKPKDKARLYHLLKEH